MSTNANNGQAGGFWTVGVSQNRGCVVMGIDPQIFPEKVYKILRKSFCPKIKVPFI